MSRTALARTYRPRRFGELTMQEHVSDTLKAAVARGRVAHAYLFCGPRGVGKTTAARVLAMALNCPERSAEGEPCGACESCQRIWAGRTSLDVVEIDAASNRGVDDARDLRERAMYAPTDEHRYKVYIIDEAHMLTREAWNALLKILEEPPPRVIFVFATTEPQKIQQAAPPILSRCQRFDFRRIAVSGIVDRLQQVLAEEGVEADEEALVPLARRAEGGMRDALSLLDQVLSFADGRVTAEDVRRVLGLAGEEIYLELFDLLADHRHGEVFGFVRRLVDEGYDLTEFYRGMADALRDLLIARLEGPDALEVRGDLRAQVCERADRFATGDLLRMLAQVAEMDADGRFRKSGNPRLLLEALLLRFAHLDRTVELEALIRAAGGAPPPGGGGGGGASAALPGAPTARAAPGRSTGAEPAPGRAPEAPSASAGRGRAPAPSQAAAAAENRGSRTAPSDGGTGTSSGPSGSIAPTAPTAPRDPARRAAGAAPAADLAAAPRIGSSSPGGGTEGAGEAARPAGAPTAGGAEAALRALAVGGEGLPPGLGFFLRAARVAEDAGGRVVLEMPVGPGLEQLSEPNVSRTLAAALGRRLGRSVELEVRAAGSAGRASERLTPERLREEQLRRMVEEEPVLGKAVKELDLELLE